MSSLLCEPCRYYLNLAGIRFATSGGCKTAQAEWLILQVFFYFCSVNNQTLVDKINSAAAVVSNQKINPTLHRYLPSTVPKEGWIRQ
jgi:hypothetical protein